MGEDNVWRSEDVEPTVPSAGCLSARLLRQDRLVRVFVEGHGQSVSALRVRRGVDHVQVRCAWSVSSYVYLCLRTFFVHISLRLFYFFFICILNTYS